VRGITCLAFSDELIGMAGHYNSFSPLLSMHGSFSADNVSRHTLFIWGDMYGGSVLIWMVQANVESYTTQFFFGFNGYTRDFLGYFFRKVDG